jgi:PBSX family phage terminase large subunit
LTDALIIKPHSKKQESAIFAKTPILLLGCGTQYGKTTVGAIRMKQAMHTFTDPSDNFIITSPTYPIMTQSTLPPFLRLMEGYGTWNKKDNCFKMHQGGTCWFRTETDPDSIIGITNVRHIWADEAGKYRLYFWENIQARADFCGATIDLTTSPYALNWIYKELVKPKKAGKRADLTFVQAASWENPYHSLHDPKAREAKRATMNPLRFNMIYGGQWGRMEGLVYNCWDDEQNIVDAFQLPTETRYVAGIDWGYYPDPFVLKIRGITPDGRHYGISEFVKTRMTITDIVQLAKQKKEVYGISIFYCDPSQPGYIEEFNRNGLVAIGADNDIRRGIDLHYELIKTRRYKEFRGACPHSHDERETYHYPEEKDLKPDQDSKELLPVDKDNHTQDADRYITIETFNREIKLVPKSPGDQIKQTQQNRLEFLKRAHREQHSEKFS